jgi:hypothetical protein
LLEAIGGKNVSNCELSCCSLDMSDEVSIPWTRLCRTFTVSKEAFVMFLLLCSISTMLALVVEVEEAFVSDWQIVLP